MKGQQQIKILSTVPGRIFRSTCSRGKIEILLWHNIAVFNPMRYKPIDALCPMPYALCPMPYALCPMPYALSPSVPH